MDRLLVFGLGYTGAAIARAANEAGFQVVVASRAPRPLADGLRVVDFSDAAGAVADATCLVSTAPPRGEADGEGARLDPVLDAWGNAIAGAKHLRWLGYLSTTGVYGDRGGAWVAEDAAPAPGQRRSQIRLDAELAWREFADRRAVDLFRVAGIYGPGRSALDDVRAGRARRVDKPGHAFGRIHRDDIAAAVVAAARQDRPPGTRVLHLADDAPAAQADVVAEAARLLGAPAPPLIAYADAASRMSDMARGFWAENRKISSARTQAMLGLRWRYPSYREGLAASLAEEIGHKESGKRVEQQ